MKVRWLDDTYTRAELTRGFLWWKRVAVVHCEYDRWYYSTTGEYFVLGYKLNLSRDTLFDRARDKVVWIKPAKLPVAKLLK